MQSIAMVNFTTSILLFSLLIIALLQLCCCHKAFPNVSCIARERRALLQLRSSLVDKSNRLSSWSGEDCCNWEGVACSKSTGHVVKLHLSNPIPPFDVERYFSDPKYYANYGANYSNNCLVGEINPSLLSLEHLRYLDLSRNNFSEIQIPKYFGSLKNLRYLNLSNSYFTGKIPHDLGNLSHLQYLDLSRNDFDRRFTAKSISWVSKLSSLESLDLSYAVNLSETQDWFQAINMLPSLMSLKLVYCRLSSSPNLPHVNLTYLTLLDLSENGFNSTIPLCLCNMTSLKHLDLSSNYFHGPIPNIISQLTSLTSLYLSDNELWGPLPNSFGTLSSLTHFDLSDNDFGGSLFLVPLHNLSSLIVLDLAHNKFQGEISSDISYLRQIKELSLHDNELNGTISSNLWLLRKLEVLDISYNSLIGEISEVHFEKMKNLKYLDLSFNSLTLNVRSSWIPPFQLQIIGMDSIKIGPRFPSWLETQKNLLYLSMSNASISGNIPDWFEILHSTIHYLDLSKNLIAGPIPLEDLWKSVLWNELHLNDNYVNGSLPEYICHVRTLKILDLSNNQLSGRLPLCLGNLRDLVVLNLANNSLYGQIPSSLGYIEFLNSLHLNNNKFHGVLPLSLQYLKYMQFLDLGENELVGIIPCWIGKYLSNMRILSLQSNHFYGDVPIHLCQLSQLQVLNLAQNNLTGCIPRCFNNLSAMRLNNSDLRHFDYEAPFVLFPNRVEKLKSFKCGRELEFSNNLPYFTSLDISQNHISGGIPKELMDLVGLQSLNLSGNHLNGKITKKIGNLRNLESLDLSRNELFGVIPPSLANLNFLSGLNLSSNKLCGRIPTGNQLRTLTDPSIYADNNCLCGQPLSNNCTNDKSSQGNGPTFESEKEESCLSWFLAGLGPGFGVGFLGIFSILFFKKSWRHAYFQFVENFSNNA